jgi:hypothetical protein
MADDEQAENPESEGPEKAWKPTDKPDPNEEGTATGPPPEAVPGDSGESPARGWSGPKRS